MPGVPLLANNMTRIQQNPFYTQEQFEDFGYKMVIWPVTSLRVAAKAQEKLSTPPSNATAARITTSNRC